MGNWLQDESLKNEKIKFIPKKANYIFHVEFYYAHVPHHVLCHHAVF